MPTHNPPGNEQRAQDPTPDTKVAYVCETCLSYYMFGGLTPNECEGCGDGELPDFTQITGENTDENFLAMAKALDFMAVNAGSMRLMGGERCADMSWKALGWSSGGDGGIKQ